MPYDDVYDAPKKRRRRKPRGGHKNMDLLLEEYMDDSSFVDDDLVSDRKASYDDRDRVDYHRMRKSSKRKTRPQPDEYAD